MLPVKLRQAVCQETNKEGGGCLLQDEQCTNTGKAISGVLWENHPDTGFPPDKNPVCASFKEYEEVKKTVPLDFTEDDVTWVASKISGAAGALGSEAIELINWIIFIVCTLEELRFVVAKLADWMSNSPPPGSPIMH